MMFMLVKKNLGLLQSRGLSVVIGLITSDHRLQTHNITQQSACILFLILRFTESYTKYILYYLTHKECDRVFHMSTLFRLNYNKESNSGST
jgi:hypothetical protein